MALDRSRRSFLGALGLAALAPLATACGQSAASTGATKVPAAATGSPAGALTVLPANSEVAVGKNRFAVGVLEGGRSVAQANVGFEFFQLEGQNATKRSEQPAAFRVIDNSSKGIYVATVHFDQPGPWGVQVSASRDGQPPLVGRANFEVRVQSSAPMPGARAIASQSRIASDVTDRSEICSAAPPCEMHDLRISDGLALGKPLLVAFSTPGYCSTQTCAPVLAEVRKVRAARAAQASFIHVEIYKDPRNLVLADAVNEWGLQSEPWVFLVDRAGIVAERIESITTAEELDAALIPLV